MNNKFLVLAVLLTAATPSITFASSADEAPQGALVKFVAKDGDFEGQRNEIENAGKFLALTLQDDSSIRATLERQGRLDDLTAQLADITAKLANIQRAHDKLDAKLTPAREEAAASMADETHTTKSISEFLNDAGVHIRSAAFTNHMSGKQDMLYAIRSAVSEAPLHLSSFDEQFAWARNLISQIQAEIYKATI